MQFLKAAAVSLLGFTSTESAAWEAVRSRNEPAMQNQTEAVATLRDPLHRWDLNMAHSHQTASPFFFSTIRCSFISLPLPISWYAGSRFFFSKDWSVAIC